MSRTWHKRSETSHLTQTKVTTSPIQSKEISRSSETSRCDPRLYLIVGSRTYVPVEQSHCSHTLTYCGHKANNPSRCTRWPLRQTNVVVPDTVIFAVKPENGALLERSKATYYPGGATWVNFCWVCAVGLLEPLPHCSLFWGQL